MSSQTPGNRTRSATPPRRALNPNLLMALRNTKDKNSEAVDILYCPWEISDGDTDESTTPTKPECNTDNIRPIEGRGDRSRSRSPPRKKSKDQDQTPTPPTLCPREDYQWDYTAINLEHERYMDLEEDMHNEGEENENNPLHRLDIHGQNKLLSKAFEDLQNVIHHLPQKFLFNKAHKLAVKEFMRYILWKEWQEIAIKETKTSWAHTFRRYRTLFQHWQHRLLKWTKT